MNELVVSTSIGAEQSRLPETRAHSGSAVLCRCDLPEIVSARIEAHCCDRSADRLSQPGHDSREGMSQKNTSLWSAEPFRPTEAIRRPLGANARR